MTYTPDRESVIAWLQGYRPDAYVELHVIGWDTDQLVPAAWLLEVLERADTGGEYHFPRCDCGKPWPCEDRPIPVVG